MAKVSVETRVCRVRLSGRSVSAGVCWWLEYGVVSAAHTRVLTLRAKLFSPSHVCWFGFMLSFRVSAHQSAAFIVIGPHGRGDEKVKLASCRQLGLAKLLAELVKSPGNAPTLSLLLLCCCCAGGLLMPSRVLHARFASFACGGIHSSVGTSSSGWRTHVLQGEREEGEGAYFFVPNTDLSIVPYWCVW